MNPRLPPVESGAAKGGEVNEEIRLDPSTGEGHDDPRSPEVTRVVVVDDHPSYAHGLASLLKVLGGIDVVAITHDAEMGVECAAEYLPDVVLMDIRLPEGSGIEATRRIRAKCPEVKVAILTASNEPSDVADAMTAGAVGYLLKQSDAGQLVAGIKAVAAGQTVVEPTLSPHASSDESDHRLTEMDVRLLRLLSRGLELANVAGQLNISQSTVKRQIVQIQKKLGVSNRIQAVVAAARRGLL